MILIGEKTPKKSGDTTFKRTALLQGTGQGVPVKVNSTVSVRQDLFDC